eukprot:symbB.v1.2.012679.t1/scaffold880.1/size155533/1
MLSFETYETSVIAGDLQHWGTRDGVGPLARFWHLKRPMVTSRYVFMRTEGPDIFQWRQCRLDLQTLEVKTVIFEGIDHQQLLTYCASDTEVFVVQGLGQSLQLFTAPLDTNHEVLPAYQQFCEIDLRAPIGSVAFQLKSDARLHIDRRILAARCEYFQKMLASDQTLTEIDLSNEEAAESCPRIKGL